MQKFGIWLPSLRELSSRLKTRRHMQNAALLSFVDIIASSVCLILVHTRYPDTAGLVLSSLALTIMALMLVSLFVFDHKLVPLFAYGAHLVSVAFNLGAFPSNMVVDFILLSAMSMVSLMTCDIAGFCAATYLTKFSHRLGLFALSMVVPLSTTASIGQRESTWYVESYPDFTPEIVVLIVSLVFSCAALFMMQFFRTSELYRMGDLAVAGSTANVSRNSRRQRGSNLERNSPQSSPVGGYRVSIFTGEEEGQSSNPWIDRSDGIMGNHPSDSDMASGEVTFMLNELANVLAGKYDESVSSPDHGAATGGSNPGKTAVEGHTLSSPSGIEFHPARSLVTDAKSLVVNATSLVVDGKSSGADGKSPGADRLEPEQGLQAGKDSLQGGKDSLPGGRESFPVAKDVHARRLSMAKDILDYVQHLSQGRSGGMEGAGGSNPSLLRMASGSLASPSAGRLSSNISGRLGSSATGTGTGALASRVMSARSSIGSPLGVAPESDSSGTGLSHLGVSSSGETGGPGGSTPSPSGPGQTAFLRHMLETYNVKKMTTVRKSGRLSTFAPPSRSLAASSATLLRASATRNSLSNFPAAQSAERAERDDSGVVSHHGTEVGNQRDPSSGSLALGSNQAVSHVTGAGHGSGQSNRNKDRHRSDPVQFRPKKSSVDLAKEEIRRTTLDTVSREVLDRFAENRWWRIPTLKGAEMEGGINSAENPDSGGDHTGSDSHPDSFGRSRNRRTTSITDEANLPAHLKGDKENLRPGKEAEAETDSSMRNVENFRPLELPVKSLESVFGRIPTQEVFSRPKSKSARRRRSVCDIRYATDEVQVRDWFDRVKKGRHEQSGGHKQSPLGQTASRGDAQEKPVSPLDGPAASPVVQTAPSFTPDQLAVRSPTLSISSPRPRQNLHVTLEGVSAIATPEQRMSAQVSPCISSTLEPGQRVRSPADDSNRAKDEPRSVGDSENEADVEAGRCVITGSLHDVESSRDRSRSPQETGTRSPLDGETRSVMQDETRSVAASTAPGRAGEPSIDPAIMQAFQQFSPPELLFSDEQLDDVDVDEADVDKTSSVLVGASSALLGASAALPSASYAQPGLSVPYSHWFAQFTTSLRRNDRVLVDVLGLFPDAFTASTVSLRNMSDFPDVGIPQSMSSSLPALLGRIGRWNVDMFELASATNGNPLQVVGYVLMAPVLERILDRLEISQGGAVSSSTPEGVKTSESKTFSRQVMLKRLRNLLYAAERRYWPAPYHNSIHAADVTNSVAALCRMYNEAHDLNSAVGMSSENLGSSLDLTHSFDQMGLAHGQSLEHMQLKSRVVHRTKPLDDLHQLALMFAAAIHDIGHMARSNKWHIVTQDSLALIYNDDSPLESMHTALGFYLLTYPECNFLEPLSDTQYTKFRKLVMQAVLGTDPRLHSEVMGRAKKLSSMDVQMPVQPSDRGAVGGHGSPGGNPPGDPGSGSSVKGSSVLGSGAPSRSASSPPLTQEETELIQAGAVEFMLRSADIGHMTKDPVIHRRWSIRIYVEFFAEGDAEKEFGVNVGPLNDRSKAELCQAQIGFLNFVVVPNYDVLHYWIDGPYRDGQNAMSGESTGVHPSHAISSQHQTNQHPLLGNPGLTSSMLMPSCASFHCLSESFETTVMAGLRSVKAYWSIPENGKRAMQDILNVESCRRDLMVRSKSRVLSDLEESRLGDSNQDSTSAKGRDSLSTIPGMNSNKSFLSSNTRREGDQRSLAGGGLQGSGNMQGLGNLQGPGTQHKRSSSEAGETNSVHSAGEKLPGVPNASSSMASFLNTVHSPSQAALMFSAAVTRGPEVAVKGMSLKKGGSRSGHPSPKPAGMK